MCWGCIWIHYAQHTLNRCDLERLGISDGFPFSLYLSPSLSFSLTLLSRHLYPSLSTREQYTYTCCVERAVYKCTHSSFQISRSYCVGSAIRMYTTKLYVDSVRLVGVRREQKEINKKKNEKQNTNHQSLFSRPLLFQIYSLVRSFVRLQFVCAPIARNTRQYCEYMYTNLFLLYV